MKKAYSAPSVRCILINTTHSILAASEEDPSRYKVNDIDNGTTSNVGDDADED